MAEELNASGESGKPKAEKNGGTPKKSRKTDEHREPQPTTVTDAEVAAEDAGTDDGLGDTEQDLTVRCETAEKEAQDSYDRLLRVSAEFENYKKRMQRDISETRKFAVEALINQLLPVIDNLERALDALDEKEKTVNALFAGVDMTHKELLKVLERFHVTPIEARGQPFDPAYHQAMMQEQNDTQPENTVISEMQKGYLIHDRLLRPAMVVVSKGPDEPPEKN
jgi:molecular chaperone GrpE